MDTFARLVYVYHYIYCEKLSTFACHWRGVIHFYLTHKQLETHGCAFSTVTTVSTVQGWGQLHNINSNSNSNSRGFNSNSNSGQSPEYQLQLQLQLRRFQLQLQLQLRQISRISTPTPTPTPEVSTPTPIPTPEISTPIPTPTPEFQIQPQLHFKSYHSCSTKLPLPNYNVKHCMD